MSGDLYDILVDSSNTDFKNGQILMQTGMYYYSITFYVQSINKMLNLIYIHYLNETLELDKDYNFIMSKLNVLPDWLKQKIEKVMEDYKTVDEQSDKVTLKMMCEDILSDTQEINQSLKKILMGKNASLILD